MALPCNVGGLDKAFRLGLTFVMVGAGVYLDVGANATGWSIAAFLVALIAAGTAFVGYCPLNAVLNIDTCKERTRT